MHDARPSPAYPASSSQQARSSWERPGWSERKHALPVFRDYTSANPLHAHDCASRKLSPLLSFVGSLHHDRVAVHGRFLAHQKGGRRAILEAHVEPHLRMGGLSLAE